MNTDTAFVRDRGMSLSEYEWTMIETALLKYGNDLASLDSPTMHQIRMAKDAWALAKSIRFTEDQRNAQRALEDALDALSDDIDSFYSN